MRGGRPAALAAACLLVLAGCGGGAEPEGAEETSASPGPYPDATVAVPEGLELTEPGSELAFGDTATVPFEPDQRRGSVVELTVDEVTQGRVRDFSGFVLDEATRTSTPYYVEVRVANVGEGDVGGAPVPLLVDDGTDVLQQPTGFTVPFRTCPSDPLPESFGPGEEFGTCLVFLVPDRGTLEAVVFRPDQDTAAVAWTGQVTPPRRQR